MKKWKRIIRNCPYLLAVIVTWLFFTIGGGVLLWYRGYDEGEWQQLLRNPLFVVAVTEEMQGKMTGTEIVGNNKKPHVIANQTKQNLCEEEKIEQKLNNNLIKTDVETEIENTGNWENAMNALWETSPENSTQDENFRITDELMLPENSEMEEIPEEVLEEEEAGEIAESEGAEENAEEQGEDAFVPGETRFETYDPIETDSIYYSDAGKIAYTTDYEYSRVTDAYFQDAAFLGDSRTLGISDYAGLEADFYCESGMTIYKLFGDKGVVYQKSGQKVNLAEVMQQKVYGKIYIMLGMNELGYGNTEKYLEQYKAVVEKIRELQPQAVIFILANLHVSAAKNNMETEFNNVNINDKNVAAATLANGTDIFYLDSNSLFVDNDGFLKADLTFDGVHLYADNYAAWKEFFMEHGVVKKDEGRTGNSIK